MRPLIGSLFCLITMIACSGCVVIESKTLVVAIPEDSKKIELCYLFEGISYLDEQRSTLNQAQTQIEGLRRDDLGFFVPDSGSETELLKVCRFEKTRFFVDPSRKRSLCADRRMTIADRDAFAKRVNQLLAEGGLAGSQKSLELDDEALRAEIADTRKLAKRPEAQELFRGMGIVPLANTLVGVLEIIDQFDAGSLVLLREAAKKKDYQWLRFEPGRARIVLPATPERAKKISSDPKTRAWLKEMKSFVSPIDVEADKEGLSIVVGKKGEVIRFTHADDRKFSSDYDDKLAKYAGSPMPILIDGKPAKATSVIDQFIKDKTPSR